MGDYDQEMMSCNGSRGQVGGSAQCMGLGDSNIGLAAGSAEEFLGGTRFMECLKSVV